jgi:chromate reductase, NAD(P)H dehydrogenase (quinone)
MTGDGMTGGDRLRVLGFSGSLRAASLNSALLRAAVEMAPETMTIEVFPLDRLPLYNEDLEKQGDPEGVTAWKAAIAAADALLIACPEYNFGISGVLKNAIDWASRPPGKSAIAGKPTAIIGASPTAGATRLAQAMTRQILSALAVPILPVPFLMLPQAGDKIQDGNVTDERTRELLARVLRGLESWAGKIGARASSP